jgi:hypothetical protein
MTSGPDFKALYLSIRRCDAVYEPDEGTALAAFRALGSVVRGRLCTDVNQAVLHRPPDGVLTLTISGTRVSEGTLSQHVHDLMQDLDCTPFDVGSGRRVARQPFQEAMGVYQWASSRCPSERLRVEGHSLGAWKTTYATEYVPADQLVGMIAWESPKQGNAAYWADLAARGLDRRLLQVYHGQDPWALWPWETDELTKGPGPLLWAKPDGSWSWAQPGELPEARFSDGYELTHNSDHGPEGVVQTFRGLAATQGGKT